jgi:polar amino acid transport system substrate-binding protein
MTRRTIGLVLAAVLAAGCQDGPAAAPPSPPPEVVTLQEGVLSVACDVPSPPFAVESGSEITGFQADLVREIARRLDLDPVLVDVPAFRINSDVALGEYDAGVTATPVTPDLEEEVDFSEPYFSRTLAVVISGKERPDVSTMEDLTLGDVVAVPDGTTAEAFAEQSLRAGGVEVRAYPNPETFYSAIETGLVDAGIDYELEAAPEVADRSGLRIVDLLSTGESYRIAVRPGRPALLEAINSALEAMIGDGTYERIYRRYPELPLGGMVLPPLEAE